MIELILIILVILVVAAVSIFAWTDYNKHKKSNETDFTKVGTEIKTEGETRLSNLKFVVDQVNKTNEDMDTTYTKKFGDIDNSLKDYNSFKAGFGSLITARNSSSNVDIPLTNLATLPATDVNMMKHVSFLGGATIKDLQNSVDKSNMRLKMCGVGDKPACIEVPNADGDTYLTSLVKDGNIVFDAPVKAYNSFGLYAPGEKTAPTLSLQGATAEQANVAMKATGSLSVRTGDAEVMNVSKGGAKVMGSVTLQNATGQSAVLSVGNNGELNVAGASKVIVNGQEVAFVATNQTAIVSEEVMVAPTTPVITPTPVPAPAPTEGFCTAAANQGQNFQCVQSNSPLNKKYFKVDQNTLYEYANELAWQQAVNNGAPAANPVSDCSIIQCDRIGAPITQSQGQ